MMKSIPQGGKDQASLWREGLEEEIRERVWEVIEEIFHEEVEELLGAARSQRVEGHCEYRHGRKSRRLNPPSGTGCDGEAGRACLPSSGPRARLLNPEGEEGEWQSQLLPRYRRSSAAPLCKAYLGAAKLTNPANSNRSVRRWSDFAKSLCGGH